MLQTVAQCRPRGPVPLSMLRQFSIEGHSVILSWLHFDTGGIALGLLFYGDEICLPRADMWLGSVFADTL